MGDEITVELVGGPLDGERLTYQLSDLDPDWTQWGAHMIVPGERAHPVDPSARAVYEPIPMRPCGQWVFAGWVA